jgi:hypothetical protein
MDTERFEAYRRVRLGESHSEMVVDLKNSHRYNGPVGVWSGLTSTGTVKTSTDVDAKTVT